MFKAVFNPLVVSIFEYVAQQRGFEDGVQHVTTGDGPHTHVAMGNWLKARPENEHNDCDHAYWGAYHLATRNACFSSESCGSKNFAAKTTL